MATYTSIQGTWRFNSFIIPANSSLYISIPFRFNWSDGTARSQGINIVKVWDDHVSLQFHLVDGSYITVFESANDGWVNDECRYITLDGSQGISETFATWLYQNAAQWETINGKWLFNENANISDLEKLYTENDSSYEVKVNFASADYDGEQNTFNGILFDRSGTGNFSYKTNDSAEFLVYDTIVSSGSAWKHQASRTIDFGVDLQLVPKIFYDWIMDKATFQSQLNCAWKFTSNPEIALEEPQYIQFTSGGVSFDTIQCAEISGVKILYYNSTPVYNFKKKAWMAGDTYKTINFGPTNYVYPWYSFYKWFTPYADLQTVITGKWRLNDKLNKVKYSEDKIEQYITHYPNSDTTDGGVKIRIYVSTTAASVSDNFDSIPDRRIYFDSPNSQGQEVDPKFYSWFIENATTTRGTTGWYKFDEIVDLPATPIEQEFNFSGYVFGIGRINSPASLALSSDSLSFYCGGKEITGTDFANRLFYNRTIGFGMTPQQVTFEFYDWLTANAHQTAEMMGTWQLNVDFKPPSEWLRQGNLTLHGKYKFDDVGWVDGVDSALIEMRESSGFIITNENTGEELYVSYGDEYYFEVLENRCISFGFEPQPVKPEFFNWFYENAVYAFPEPDRFLIYGDTLTDIANAIRKKTGETDKIVVSDYAKAIERFRSDTWCGEYTDNNWSRGVIVSYQGSLYKCIKDTTNKQKPTDSTYWELIASVPDQLIFGEKIVVPTSEEQIVTADGVNSALSKVTVLPIPSDYVKPTGDIVITDPSYRYVDVKNYEYALIDVPRGYCGNFQAFGGYKEGDVVSYLDSAYLCIQSHDVGQVHLPTETGYWMKVGINTDQLNLQSKTVTPTKETLIVKYDSQSQYVGLREVTVNPIPDEYIIPADVINISTNGIHDVSQYAAAVVSISGSEGSFTIPAGTYEPNYSNGTSLTPSFNSLLAAEYTVSANVTGSSSDMSSYHIDDVCEFDTIKFSYREISLTTDYYKSGEYVGHHHLYDGGYHPITISADTEVDPLFYAIFMDCYIKQ